MPKYGLIKNGELLTRAHMSQGYKPLVYGEIPEDFYEETHFLIEKEPEEFESYIFIGYEANELEIEVDEETELTLEEVKAGIEERKKKYFKSLSEPTEIDMQQAQIQASSDYVDFLEEVVVELIQAVYQ